MMLYHGYVTWLTCFRPDIVGAAVDTCADIPVTSESDCHKCGPPVPANSIDINTVSGKTTSNTTVEMKISPWHKVKSRAIKGAKKSIIPTTYFTQKGWTYVQNSISAGLVKGNEVIQLVPQGKHFTMPVGKNAYSTGTPSAELNLAMGKLRQQDMVRKRVR